MFTITMYLVLKSFPLGKCKSCDTTNFRQRQRKHDVVRHDTLCFRSRQTNKMRYDVNVFLRIAAGITSTHDTLQYCSRRFPMTSRSVSALLLRWPTRSKTQQKTKKVHLLYTVTHAVCVLLELSRKIEVISTHVPKQNVAYSAYNPRR